MKIKNEKTGRYVLLIMNGNICGERNYLLSEKIEEATAGQCKNLVLDLNRTLNIDSSGLGLLIFHKKRLEKLGGEVVFMGVQGYLRKLVEDSGLSKVFRIVNKEDEI